MSDTVQHLKRRFEDGLLLDLIQMHIRSSGQSGDQGSRWSLSVVPRMRTLDVHVGSYIS